MNIRHKLASVLDVCSIVVGCSIWLLVFILPEFPLLRPLTIFAAAFGIGYIAYAIRLVCRRPSFDWHLIHGNFLRKVICLVILVPVVISIPLSGCLETEELAYEHSLYESYVNETDLKKEQVDPPFIWSVYYHFIDPGNQHMTMTKAGRGWAALISILGVFLLNGLLVSSIVGWVDSRKERWLKGEVKYKNFLKRKKHYIIIGGNDMVTGIVTELLRQPDAETTRYVLIQTVSDVENFRRALFSNLTVEEQKKVIIYYGNRNSEEDIKELVLETAEEVYVLGEETRTDDIESYHDTMNMKCLDLIYEYAKNIPVFKTKKLQCRVLFEYQTTFSVFQFFDIEKSVSGIIDFKPFNYYEMWAQKVLINRELNADKLRENFTKANGYLPLEGVDGISETSDEYVHLFIVGMSRMGVAMGIEAAHLAHYPNYSEESKIRTKITFIDKNAVEEKDFFVGRFKEMFSLSHWRYGNVQDGTLVWEKPHMVIGNDHLGGDFLDVEWEFINGGVEQNAVQKYMLACADPRAKVTVAICLPESNRSHAAAMYLDKEIYESDRVQQVLVFNRYGDSIVGTLNSPTPRSPYYNKLKSFGSPKESYSKQYTVLSERIGNAIGNRYTEINEKFIQPAKDRIQQKDGDYTYKGKSKVANFWSNIYNGNTMWTKLRCIGYNGAALTQDQIEIISDVEHNRWNVEQLLMNFRPLTESEQEQVISDPTEKDRFKGEMAHFNICSNRRLIELSDVDAAARAYDVGLTTLMYEIYTEISTEQPC